MAKIRIEFRPKDKPEKFRLALQAIATREFYAKVIPLDELREKAVSLIRENFPSPAEVAYRIGEGSTSQEFSVEPYMPQNLGEGFRAYSFGTSLGQAGFTVRHRRIEEEKIEKAIAVIEYGAKEHVVRARPPRQYLRFVGEMRDKRNFGRLGPIYRKQIRVPSTRGSKFLEESLRGLEVFIQSKIKRGLPGRIEGILLRHGIKPEL